MPLDYTEDQLVEQPAMGLTEEFGLGVGLAKDEVLGTGGTLGCGQRKRMDIACADRSSLGTSGSSSKRQ